jgi:precorrin-6B methylase 1
MEVEIISGVKTTWHSDKKETLQNIANLLFKLFCENRRLYVIKNLQGSGEELEAY